jgi:hypothetical protein
MKPEDIDFVAGVLAHEVHVGGSKLFPCAECGRKVWMAPTSQRFLQSKPSARVICIQCAEVVCADLEPTVLPGMIEELLGWRDRN